MVTSSSFITVVSFILFNIGIHRVKSFSIPNHSLNHVASNSKSSLHATWSNGQAIQEYQDFLASGKQEIEKLKDCPSVIVKPLNQASPANLMVDALMSLGNGDDVVIPPLSPMPQLVDGRESFPIYIAVPPNELDEFIKYLPEDWKPRREDFVFLSGGNLFGCIEPILKNYG
jgi:hypothetical protein